MCVLTMLLSPLDIVDTLRKGNGLYRRPPSLANDFYSVCRDLGLGILENQLKSKGSHRQPEGIHNGDI